MSPNRLARTLGLIAFACLALLAITYHLLSQRMARSDEERTSRVAVLDAAHRYQEGIRACLLGLQRIDLGERESGLREAQHGRSELAAAAPEMEGSFPAARLAPLLDLGQRTATLVDRVASLEDELDRTAPDTPRAASLGAELRARLSAVLELSKPSVLEPPLEDLDPLQEMVAGEGHERSLRRSSDFLVLGMVVMTGCVLLLVIRQSGRQVRAANEKAALLSLVAEHTDNGVLISDKEVRIRWANAAFTRITGYELSEVSGRHPWEVLGGPRTDPAIVERIHANVRAGRGSDFEIQVHRKDGSPIWLKVELRPVRDEDGVTGFVSVEIDVTETHAAEERLLHEKERFEGLAERVSKEHGVLSTVLTHVPYAVFWKDRASVYLGCNEKFAELAGLASPQDIVGLDDYDMPWTREESDWYRKCDAELMAKGEPLLDIEETQQNSEGRRTVIVTSKVPLHDENGEVSGVLGIFADVTERRNLETELAQARRLEAIGNLAAGVAHEINTPAQYVADNTRFLQQTFPQMMGAFEKLVEITEPDSPPISWDERAKLLRQLVEEMDLEFLVEEVPRALTQSIEGLAQVTSIVRAMKDFSHPGTDRKVRADLNRAIESTTTIARNEWKYVADLELDLDPELPTVPCLPGELNQVILNMVVNAAHAIGEKIRQGGGPKGVIRVSSRKVDERVEIRVQDTGTGIPDDVLEKIWEPFFTTKDVGMGTGQGLSIARGVVVNKHGGTIDVETEVGKGTTFIVRIPLEDAEEEAVLAA